MREIAQRRPNERRARPLGIWLLSSLYGFLSILGLCVALYQFIDPFVFEGQEYSMWSRGLGHYVAILLVLALMSVVGLLAGKRVARFGILLALVIVLVALVYDARQAFLFIRDEYPGDIRSIEFWWYIMSFPVIALALLVATGWYLFGVRTRRFFAERQVSGSV